MSKHTSTAAAALSVFSGGCRDNMHFHADEDLTQEQIRPGRALYEFLYEQETYSPVVRLRCTETGAVVGITKHGFERCFKLVRRAA